VLKRFCDVTAAMMHLIRGGFYLTHLTNLSITNSYFPNCWKGRRLVYLPSRDVIYTNFRIFRPELHSPKGLLGTPVKFLINAII